MVNLLVKHLLEINVWPFCKYKPIQQRNSNELTVDPLFPVANYGHLRFIVLLIDE